MKNSNWIYLLVVGCMLVFAACEKTYTPKPKSYPRIIFPKHQYQTYSDEFCPFTFDYPIYAIANKDTMFFDQKVKNPCWLNLEYPQFSGTLHITYEDVNNKDQIAKFLDDAHSLTYKHSKKADAIDPIEINNKNGVHGLIYDVGGNAASSVQFYVTDMNQHFLRGALYFNVKPNIDSMAPVINFVNQDLTYLIESFKWK